MNHTSFGVLIIASLSTMMAFRYRHLPASLSAAALRHGAASSSAAFINGLNTRRFRCLDNNDAPPSRQSPLQTSMFQRRNYHINLARDTYTQPDNKELQPLTAEEMKRNNLISVRLYRILLRSCIRGIKIANAGNKIESSAANNKNTGEKEWILLQPPLDVRKYGHANILRVRKGELYSMPEGNELSRDTVLNYMSKEEVGRAMDVLRFVHTSLGGNEDDDLEHYYLNLPSPAGDEAASKTNKFVSGDTKDLGAAVKHSEGHYTQFLDEDEERGEADNEKDEYYPQHEQLQDEDDDYPNPQDQSVLVKTGDIVNAIRIAFRAPITPSPDDNEQKPMSLQSILTRRHRDAIDASSLLSEQITTWSNKSSICLNAQHGVRIVATSSTMQLLTKTSKRDQKYRFAYRIRVENVNDDDRVVQLLGRTWNVYECRKTSASLLNRLLEESISNEGIQDEQDDIQVRTLVQNVNEPKTGAVGHFPVIRPGEVFEYISGAELSTPTGYMEGSFHMAIVDPETAESSSIGEPVDALLWKEGDERKFEATVAEFGFVVDEEQG